MVAPRHTQRSLEGVLPPHVQLVPLEAGPGLSIALVRAGRSL